MKVVCRLIVIRGARKPFTTVHTYCRVPDRPAKIGKESTIICKENFKIRINISDFFAPLELERITHLKELRFLLLKILNFLKMHDL